jgi:hypothetical protein
MEGRDACRICLAPIQGRRHSTQLRYCGLRCRRKAERIALQKRRLAEAERLRRMLWERLRAQGLVADRPTFTEAEWELATLHALGFKGAGRGLVENEK